MEQYKEIINEILEKGVWKEPARVGMPRTISRFSIEKRFDLSNGFPLVTIKETKFKNIAHELIWFLRGDTNIKYLVDNGVNIWNNDAYKYYKRLNKAVIGFGEGLPIENFINHIKDGDLKGSLICAYLPHYKLGDTGFTYPVLWNKFPAQTDMDIDQIQRLVNGLKVNPNSRYHIINAWHPCYINDMATALPPCHMLAQFNMRPIQNEGCKGYILDCKLVQRSCDTFLGVPYNIASYALLVHYLAKLVGAIPGELIWSGNDVHLYENHVELAKSILEREPKKLPSLWLSNGIDNLNKPLSIEDIHLENYEHHPFVKGELSVGE